MTGPKIEMIMDAQAGIGLANINRRLTRLTGKPLIVKVKPEREPLYEGNDTKGYHNVGVGWIRFSYVTGLLSVIYPMDYEAGHLLFPYL